MNIHATQYPQLQRLKAKALELLDTISEYESAFLSEDTIRPLSPEQQARRRQRDQDRRRRIADIQANTKRRVESIRSELGR
jgi:hypothetical protein